MKVAEVDAPTPMGIGRHSHDSVGDAWQQKVRQREMPEVVRSDLPLEAIYRSGEGHEHYSRIVDQDVDRIGPSSRKRADRGQIFEIEVAYQGGPIEGARDPPPLLDIAYCQDDRGTRARQGPRTSGTDAADAPVITIVLPATDEELGECAPPPPSKRGEAGVAGVFIGPGRSRRPG